MRPIAFIVLTVCMSLPTGRLLAGNQPAAEDELTKIKREYGDVLALQGASKGEILAIARILRAKPDIAIDQTAASGEYSFNSGLGTMVHFATQPERTPEDVVYEFDTFPEDRTEKDLERHVAPAIRAHMKNFLESIESRQKPVSDIEQGYMSTTACILANISMQLGRTIQWDHAQGTVVGDPEANTLLARKYRAPWTHPVKS